MDEEQLVVEGAGSLGEEVHVVEEVFEDEDDGDELGLSASAPVVPPENENAFEKARRLLQLSEVPEFLPCRGTEGYTIEEFLRNSLTVGSSHPILYISGVPGTGKTASAINAIRRIQKEVESEKKLPAFDYVYINGMDLAETKKAFSVLWFFLTQDKESPALAEKYLTERFSARSSKKCVLLLDEMDKLISERKQAVLYQLFNWATGSRARRLTIIGIANTMNLEESLMLRVQSRLGNTRLSFAPYSREQLEEIINERLKNVDAFDASAVKFSSAWIASFSGDARRALRICRRAADLAELDMYKQELNGELSEEAKKRFRVTSDHVKLALDEFKSSPVIQTMQNASKFEKVFICAFLKDLKATGNSHAVFDGVVDRFYALCNELGVKQRPSMTVVYGILDQLSSCGLFLQNPRKDLAQKVKLNYDVADIYEALKQDLVIGKYLPENLS